MAIVIPETMPAFRHLRRAGVPAIPAGTSMPAGPRPLRVALLNLMPTKADTETQFARLLATAGRDVALTLFVPDSYRGKNTSPNYLRAFYRRWSELRGETFDALIVTGAPVERMDFADVAYWGELQEIFAWAERRVGRVICVCWAAQAALHHFHGVPKSNLPAKRFGVFWHRVEASEHRLLDGFGTRFCAPCSRHTTVREDDLPANAGLNVLSRSRESGLCLVEDVARRWLYVFDHLEYDAATLAREYRRDQARGDVIAVPRNYFPADNPMRRPLNTWRPYAHRLFNNWLGLVADDIAGEERAARSIGWVLAPGRGSEIRIEGWDAPNLLPRIRDCLTRRGLTAGAMTTRQGPDGKTVVAFPLDGADDVAVERVACALTALPWVCRVGYRCPRGGGLLVHRGTVTEMPATVRAARAA